MLPAKLLSVFLFPLFIHTTEQAPLLTGVREVSNYSLSLVFDNQCATRDEIKDELKFLVKNLTNEIRSLKIEYLPFTKGTSQNPGTSCKELLSSSQSGLYWIKARPESSAKKMYCDMERTCCGETGGWTKVANLDMTDPNQQCPNSFRLINRPTAPLRTCGRPGPVGCVSTTFPVHGIEYSHVCGRIVGYQEGSPDAFAYYNFNKQITIDTHYIDGVSLTHGQSPRKHIWSFVGAVSEGHPFNQHVCPCTRNSGSYSGTVPPFIDEDYFCDTAIRGLYWIDRHLYPEDPLWDGQGCGSTSTCCSFNNPPWFCKQLPQSTTDDIELRICNLAITRFDDTPIEIAELYIR